MSRTLSGIACYLCGELFYKGCKTKCKAMSMHCFTCQKIGHLSTQCRSSCVRTVNVMVVKRKSTHRKKSVAKSNWPCSWLDMRSPPNSYSVKFLTQNYFFLEGLDLKTNISGAEKGNYCCKEDFSTKGIDNKQQKNHVIFEQNLEKEQRKHDLITNTSSDYERKA